jgi:hypothetical protein
MVVSIPSSTAEQLSVVQRLKSRTTEVCKIPLSDLRVDLRFQRRVDTAKVKAMMQSFHPEALHVITVTDLTPLNPADPKYAVIDGQTRLMTVRALQDDPQRVFDQGIELPTHLDAKIFHGAEADECALLFLLLNAQKAVGTGDRQRVSVTTGNPVMLSIVEQFRVCGHVIYPEDPMDSTVKTSDISAAEKIVRLGEKLGRPELLTEAINIQTEAFKSEHSETLGGTLNADTLWATAELLGKNPDLNPTALARVMHDHSGIFFERDRLVERGQMSGQRITARKAIQVVLAERYNKGHRGGARLKV